MDEISMRINITKKYELKYWDSHRNDLQNRSAKMMDIFSLPAVEISADVGCGPRCGIFQRYKSPVMYAIDPLWNLYQKEGLCVIPPGVDTIKGEAETFRLPQACDLIVSVNALDHSGSLKSSIDNVMLNLKIDGCFYLHIHMRTKRQLNKGHQMLITEAEIDDIFSQWDTVNKQIYPVCPIEDKPYKSYVASIRKSFQEPHPQGEGIAQSSSF